MIEIQESDIRKYLKTMCRLPISFLQLGGLTLLSLNDNNQLHFQSFGYPSFFAIFQLFILFLPYSKQASHGVMDSRAEFVGDFTDIDQFAHWTVVGFVTFGYVLIRIVNAVNLRRHSKFHENLNEISNELIFFQGKILDATSVSAQEFTKAIGETTKYLRKIGKVIAGIITALCVAMFFSLLHILRANLFRMWAILLTPILLIDYSVAVVMYYSQDYLYILYIKWLGLGYHFIKINFLRLLNSEQCSESDNDDDNAHVVLENKLQSLLGLCEKLERIVDEFNSLFQVPIIIWLFSTCVVLMQQLYMVMTWLNVGEFQVLLSFAVATPLYPINIYILCNAGTVFVREVQQNIEDCCKCIAMNAKTLKNEKLKMQVYNYIN
ncbi:unnamed protein product [Orchesella dallaii]|uniref:Gustatory receptor n=1 Tax=Orchesella dallaii TaxID=48710 RepID=A0ABP1QKV3_9HEXA